MGCTLVVGDNSNPRLVLKDFRKGESILSRILVIEMSKSLDGFLGLIGLRSSKIYVMELILGQNPTLSCLFFYF